MRGHMNVKCWTGWGIFSTKQKSFESGMARPSSRLDVYALDEGCTIPGVRLYFVLRKVTYYDIFVNCNWVSPGGSSTVHIYTQTIHRMTKNKQYTEQHKNVIGTVRFMPRLGELYPGICLTTEEKARKNLSQGG
jgi:hypothetical protein